MTLLRKIVYALVFMALIAPMAAQAGETRTLPFFVTPTFIDRSVWHLSHGWTNGDYQACEWRADALSIKNGNLVMTLSDRSGRLRKYGCPALQSNARFGYGRYETRMRSAAGSGLNSNFFTYVGPPMGVKDHDEIDFEFLGKDPTTVELSHWVSGVRIAPYVHKLGFDASKDFHNYTFEWTPTSIKWFVDGKQVYQTAAGAKIPSNPGKIIFSLWNGAPIENAWMGPFTYNGPVTAEVAWVKFTPLP